LPQPTIPIWIPENLPAILGIAGAVLVLIIIAGLARGGRGGAGGKADMYAYIIDETDNTLSFHRFTKIADRVYVSLDSNVPLFLIVPPNTRPYQCVRGRNTFPCYLAYARGLMATPPDPKITSAVSLLLSSDDMVQLSNEDVVKLLRYLYDMEEKKLGRITIAAPMSIAFAFDVKKLVGEIISRIFTAASDAVTHFFRTARNIETVERWLQALGAYAERRWSWLWYLIILIIVVGAVAVAILNVLPGLFGPAK